MACGLAAGWAFCRPATPYVLAIQQFVEGDHPARQWGLGRRDQPGGITGIWLTIATFWAYDPSSP
jgi:hypothetical protein